MNENEEYMIENLVATVWALHQEYVRKTHKPGETCPHCAAMREACDVLEMAPWEAEFCPSDGVSPHPYVYVPPDPNPEEPPQPPPIKANYEVVRSTDGWVIIRDLGPWDKYTTVTNDAEAVVERLILTGGVSPPQRLFYYDSENELNELMINWREKKFHGFAYHAPKEVENGED